jgi:hypothetical protein
MPIGIAQSSIAPGTDLLAAIATGAKVRPNADEFAGTLKAGVERPAQFLVLLQEGIGLVDQQRDGRERFDGPERSRSGKVVGFDRATAEKTKQFEQRGLAAPLDRAGDREPRRVLEALEGPLVQCPSGDHIDRCGRDHDIAPDRRGKIVEEVGAVHRLGPGLDIAQRDTAAGRGLLPGPQGLDLAIKR